MKKNTFEQQKLKIKEEKETIEKHRNKKFAHHSFSFLQI